MKLANDHTLKLAPSGGRSSLRPVLNSAALASYVAQAEAARDAAVDISNIATPDDLVEDLVLNTGGAGPKTSAALATAIAAQVPSEVADALVDDPTLRTYAESAVDDRLASAGSLGAITLAEGYMNLPGGTGNYAKTPDSTVTVGTSLALAATGDTITKTAHGLPNGTVVRLSSIVSATGVTAGTDYFVVGATTNTFQLSATYGGSTVDITADGTATVTAYPLHLRGDFDLRVYFAEAPASAGVGFQTLLARRDADTEFSFRLSNGTPQFITSTDGSTLNTQGSTGGSVVTALGVRATRRASDGRIQFFVSNDAGAVTLTDGSKWSQSGSDRTGLTGALAAGTAALSVGGLGSGSNALQAKVSKVEVRNGLDGTLVASIDFRHRNGEKALTGTQGNVWTLYGTAELIADASTATKTTSTVSLETVGGAAKQIKDYRGVPYKDPHTGRYLPRGFDRALTNPTAAIQAALNAARDAGGGTVELSETYTLTPSTETGVAYTSALFIDSNVSLVGTDPNAAKLILANGANCMIVSGRGLLDGSGLEDYTSNVVLDGFTLDGNNTNQTSGTTRIDLHALHLRRFNNRRLGRLRIQNVAGRGVMWTGGAGVGTPGTRTVRPAWETFLSIYKTNGCGYYAGGTNRQMYNAGIHVEQAGLAGGEPGVFLDHSEDESMTIVAYNCPGDGIYYHNVQMSRYCDHRAIACGGYGMVFKSLVNSTVRDIKAWANSQSMTSSGGVLSGAAATASLDGVNYRSEFTQTAEIIIGNGGSYGATKNTVFDGIHAPGDKTFGGPAPDNRFANYSVIIGNGVDAGITLEHFYPGDGGLVGNVLDLR